MVLERLACSPPFEAPKGWKAKWIHGQGRCVQGNNTQDTHTGDLAYAFDFKLKPGTKVLAARAGVVAALCDHFREGGSRKSLLPRANFIALRHPDGTYTRYVHLMPDGVLVELGEHVRAGQAIGLSGNTGYTTGAHLHFDAVNILPQETSELQVVYPVDATIPSIAAIFSGPLERGGDVTGPLVYLSPMALLCCLAPNGPSSISNRYPTRASVQNERGYPVERRSGSSAGPQPAAEAAAAAAAIAAFLVPVLLSHSHVVILIDRGGVDGEQTFAEASEMAGDAIASVQMSAAFRGLTCGSARGAPSHNVCRCAGVIVANDRPGHELFPMAPPAGQSCGDGGQHRRAPFPVVMVSHESGQLLKAALSPNADLPGSPFTAATATAPTPNTMYWPLEQGNLTAFGGGGGVGFRQEFVVGGGMEYYNGWYGEELNSALSLPQPPSPAAATVPGDEDVLRGLIVSLEAATHCGATPHISASDDEESETENSDPINYQYIPNAYAGDERIGALGAFGYQYGHLHNGLSWDATATGAGWLCEPSGAWRADNRRVEHTGEWKQERMLYGAQTIPVTFV